jgi:hypothetical protein
VKNIPLRLSKKEKQQATQHHSDFSSPLNKIGWCEAMVPRPTAAMAPGEAAAAPPMLGLPSSRNYCGASRVNLDIE